MDQVSPPPSLTEELEKGYHLACTNAAINPIRGKIVTR